MKSSKISIERVRKVISELNPIDDLVFRKLSESKEFCEEILREEIYHIRCLLFVKEWKKS